MLNKKTETATFRFDKGLLDNLKKLSNQENVSLNVTVSQILESYLQWQLTAPDAGWIVMIKSFLVDMIKEIDEETVAKIATKSSKNTAKDIALIMRGEFNEKDWISIIKQRAKRSGFRFLEYEKNGKLEHIMHHKMGIRWSIYFISYYENIFHELNVPVTFDYTDETITMVFSDN